MSHTPGDVYQKLANAKYITVIDFKKSFWQFVMDEESSYLTTFNTPFGCYRYLRLPFGTNVSGDCHQRGVDSIYGKLDNVIGIADDLLIWEMKKMDLTMIVLFNLFLRPLARTT